MHTVSLDLQNMTCDKTTLQKLANRLASLKGDVSQNVADFLGKLSDLFSKSICGRESLTHETPRVDSI